MIQRAKASMAAHCEGESAPCAKTDCPRTDLRGISFGSVYGSIISRFGASGNPGTVQCNLNEYLPEEVREKGLLEMERWGLKNQLRPSSQDWERACRSPFRWAIATFVSKFVRGN